MCDSCIDYVHENCMHIETGVCDSCIDYAHENCMHEKGSSMTPEKQSLNY